MEHATKRFGQNEKFKLFMSEFNQLRCGLCSLRFAADKDIVKLNKIKKKSEQGCQLNPKKFIKHF